MAEKSRIVGRVFKQQGCKTGPLRIRLIQRSGASGRMVKIFIWANSQIKTTALTATAQPSAITLTSLLGSG
ncbi:MAG: hypothetical protein EBY24_18030 [Betaproteobacteria bacterium]|nr:hypothetical protein [Betaproteobacteria bacterium]